MHDLEAYLALCNQHQMQSYELPAGMLEVTCGQVYLYEYRKIDNSNSISFISLCINFKFHPFLHPSHSILLHSFPFLPFPFPKMLLIARFANRQGTPRRCRGRCTAGPQNRTKGEARMAAAAVVLVGAVVVVWPAWPLSPPRPALLAPRVIV